MQNEIRELCPLHYSYESNPVLSYICINPEYLLYRIDCEEILVYKLFTQVLEWKGI